MLQLFVYDKNFDAITIIDTYESVIWVDRYNQAGEFELYLPADPAYLSFLVEGNYLKHRLSEKTMIIESLQIETDVEEGSHFTVKGRSLESILSRRIIWNQTDVTDVTLETAIMRLLSENVVNPTIAERAISNFIVEESGDERLSELKVTQQWIGTNLYDAITELCTGNDVGYKITLNDQNQFVFKLYMGLDKTYYQSENDYVVFSEKFDNIINSNFLSDYTDYKTITLVVGEDRTRIVGANKSGVERRELYTEAKDISTKDENGNDIPSSVYDDLLEARGREKLVEADFKKTFDSSVDYDQIFVYGKHYFLGDLVQIKNEYGIQASTRVLEFTFNEDTSNGIRYFPTFEEPKLKIEYIYHHHTDDETNRDSTDPDEVTFADDYRAPSSGGCFTKAIYHIATTRSQHVVDDRVVEVVVGCPRPNDPSAVVAYCPYCGKEWTVGTQPATHSHHEEYDVPIAVDYWTEDPNDDPSHRTETKYICSCGLRNGEIVEQHIIHI